MLRPILLAALVGLALAAAQPAAAAGHGGGGAGPRPSGFGGPRHGPIHGLRRGGVRSRVGYGYGRRGRAVGGYGLGGYGLGGYGGAFPSDLGVPLAGGAGSGGSPRDGSIDVGAYRIVTAPGIVERPPGQPVVYVLNAAPRPSAADGRPSDAHPRILARDAGGAWPPGEDSGAARVVTLTVPRR